MVTSPFWSHLDRYGEKVALIGETSHLTYRQLSELIWQGANRLIGDQRKLVFIVTNNNIESLLCLLSMLAANYVVYPCSADTWHLATKLLGAFQPDLIIGAAPPPDIYTNYKFAGTMHDLPLYERLKVTDAPEFDPELSLLLPTSGSTGSVKLVRISRGNLIAAAQQVSTALSIDPSKRSITSLPISYVYGFSVIISHLHSGASLVFDRHSVADSDFWNMCRRNSVTSLAGVPWTYWMMRKIVDGGGELPPLQDLTLSGGHLDKATRKWLLDFCEARDINLYLMYGQTEATGRITVLPPSLAMKKPHAVGQVVAMGDLWSAMDGEIFYRGPNVSQGYAKNRYDLARSDDFGGILPTGDVGRLDDDGILYITGRKSHYTKMFGLRINLDEIENMFSEVAPVRITSQDDRKLIVFCESVSLNQMQERAQWVARHLRIPCSAIEFRPVDKFARSAAGKILFQQ